MKWASAIAATARMEDAVEESAEAVLELLGDARVDLVFAFVAGDYAPYFPRLAEEIRAQFPHALLVGCSAGGVAGGGHELEHQPALSLTAAHLPGVHITPFHLDGDKSAWPERVAVLADDDPCFVLLPDPFSCDAPELLDWFDRQFPGAVTLGGIASGAAEPGESALFLGASTHRDGCVGVALTGDVCAETVVAQGCRPIGTPMFVTRARDNVLLEVDGIPVLETLETLFASLPAADQALFRSALFLGLVMDPSRQVYGRGDFLIRNLLGIDPPAGALGVAATLNAGQVVQFHVRDATTSAEDLSQMLRAANTSRAAGALMFSCLGRGALLYGEADHDTTVFRQVVGDVPLGGFFCNGEIGPVRGRTFLHGYTSSFGLFRPRG